MKFGSHQFPHPVLTDFTDDINCNIEFQEHINEKDDFYEIIITYMFEDSLLNEYLQDKRVSIMCEYTCTSTILRKSISTFKSKIEFNIPKETVKGKVEFSSYLVAIQDIKGYVNPNAHSDYIDFPVDIEPGDILAYFGDFSFNAEINYHKLKAVSSFLTIEERSDIQLTEFDLDNEKIIVKLPVREFQIYKKQPIAKNPDFAPTFHSSIVFPAIIFALQNIEKYEEKLWSQVIKLRMKEDEFENLNLDYESGDIIKIAQILLGNPMKRFLKGLEIISEKT